MSDREKASISLTSICIVILVLVAGGWLLNYIQSQIPMQHNGPSKMKMVLNNLRQLDDAAQQYTLTHGVTQESYWDLVGSTTDKLIPRVYQAYDESYTTLVIPAGATQLTLSSPAFGTVTYTQ